MLKVKKPKEKFRETYKIKLMKIKKRQNKLFSQQLVNKKWTSIKQQKENEKVLKEK